MPSDLVITSRRVVTPSGVAPAAVHVTDGVITAVTDIGDDRGRRVDRVGNAAVLPGLVDTHVHLNDPGRAAWEGVETGTRAAAAGGITTLIEMPLNSIPATTSAAALAAKREAAQGRCRVDVGFWGGVVPGNEDELEPLASAGVFGFKCFLVDSGVPEFPAVGEADLEAALPILHALDAVLLVHAEAPGPIADAVGRLERGPFDPASYATYLRSRPPEAELEGITLMIRLCRQFDAAIHIVHLSAAAALPRLAGARADGLPITVETCPHYLFFAADEVPCGATQYKCAPPVREAATREGLWRGLALGTIDLVVTDHSPCPPEMKLLESGDFMRAWGGIASLQLALPIVWTAAAGRGHSLTEVARWMSEAPAELAGLSARKGRIAVGADADLVVFRPEESFVVDAETLRHRHKVTPYAGRRLSGVVEATYLRGTRIYDRDPAFRDPGATGRLLSRPS